MLNNKLVVLTTIIYWLANTENLWYQHFLWRSPPSTVFDDKRLKVLIFKIQIISESLKNFLAWGWHFYRKIAFYLFFHQHEWTKSSEKKIIFVSFFISKNVSFGLSFALERCKVFILSVMKANFGCVNIELSKTEKTHENLYIYRVFVSVLKHTVFMTNFAFIADFETGESQVFVNKN